jgi:integrase
MWLTPKPRALRFYDLRHTAATLHREAGCDPLVIKLLLGHAASDPTDDIYSHLSLEFQQTQLDKLEL